VRRRCWGQAGGVKAENPGLLKPIPVMALSL